MILMAVTPYIQRISLHKIRISCIVRGGGGVGLDDLRGPFLPTLWFCDSVILLNPNASKSLIVSHKDLTRAWDYWAVISVNQFTTSGNIALSPITAIVKGLCSLLDCIWFLFNHPCTCFFSWSFHPTVEISQNFIYLHRSNKDSLAASDKVGSYPPKFMLEC